MAGCKSCFSLPKSINLMNIKKPFPPQSPAPNPNLPEKKSQGAAFHYKSFSSFLSALLRRVSMTSSAVGMGSQSLIFRNSNQCTQQQQQQDGRRAERNLLLGSTYNWWLRSCSTNAVHPGSAIRFIQGPVFSISAEHFLVI